MFSGGHQDGGDGMRCTRTNGGVTTRYNWINDEDGNGDLLRSYINGFAEIAGANPATGAITYSLPEANGSPRMLMSDSGAMLGQYEFTPYGMILVHSGDSKDNLYTGHEWDPAAKLYYARARYYDPVQCRWTTREPLGLDGPNCYCYCYSNPVAGFDPDGRAVAGVICVIIGGALFAFTIAMIYIKGDVWTANAKSNMILLIRLVPLMVQMVLCQLV